MCKLLVMTVAALCLASCRGYSTGAPASACATMTPGHGTTATATLGTSYSITASMTTYAPGNKITVTIGGTGGATFRGFLVEIRKQTDNITVGTWTAPTGGKLACTNAGVTHTTNNDKTSIAMVWTAPSTSAGAIRVWVTIVQVHDTWKTIPGPVINVAAATTTTKKPTTTTKKPTTTTKKPTTTTKKPTTTTKKPTTTTKKPIKRFHELVPCLLQTRIIMLLLLKPLMMKTILPKHTSSYPGTSSLLKLLVRRQLIFLSIFPK